MFERERQVEAEKLKHSGMMASSAVLDPAQSRHLMGSLQPREFLQRIFPAVNPNLLELVWQGCGGNLERAIEQLVSNAPSMAAAAATAAASHRQQQVTSHHVGLVHHQMALQQKLAAMAVAQPKPHHGLPQGVLVPTTMSAGLGGQPLPLCQLKAVSAAAAAAMRPTGGCAAVAPSPEVALAAGVYPPVYQAAMLGRMPFPHHPAARLPPAAPVPTGVHKDLLSQKSAFHSHVPAAATSPESPTSTSGSTSSSPERTVSVTTTRTFQSAPVPTTAKSPIKFSVESIIGK